MGGRNKMASAPACGNYRHGSKKREVPYQDFSRIKTSILGKAVGQGGRHWQEQLYTDPSFPPDQSSLTYVYSGDDKYEKMCFQRPKTVSEEAVFTGVGGACNVNFPSRQWRQKAWFKAALVVVSLSVRHMERLVPAYRTLEQRLDKDYVGAFRFNLWRFGEWIEVVVDDWLPVLHGELAFCPAMGNPPEFWAPLVEKAYAKCSKTYEAIEVGKTLDALTDLTGALCEFYTPDVNPPENLFHVLYKSSVNRAFMVCWRNDKRLTSTGFDQELNRRTEVDNGHRMDNSDKYLNIITATTKFPTMDGRYIEMVRLKCLYPDEPKWNGKFCDRDTMSWNSLNKDFSEKYKPLTHKDQDEFWICLEDFRCNFGGLIVCSSNEPFRCQGFNMQRKYIIERHRGSTTSSSLKTSVPSRASRHSIDRMGGSTSAAMEKYVLKGRDERSRSFRSNSWDICVREGHRTVKIDNSEKTHTTSSHKSSTGDSQSSPDFANAGVSIAKLVKKRSLRKQLSGNKSSARKVPQMCFSEVKVDFSSPKEDRLQKGEKDTSSDSSDFSGLHPQKDENTFSTSDIYVTVQASRSRENSACRPRSAPVHIPRAQSTGSLSSLTQSTFLASRADHFRSHGAWQEIIYYRGTWQKKSETEKLQVESKRFGHRILLPIAKSDAINENIALAFEGRSHVILSLMQDYRRGSSCSSVILAHIGFHVYKTKNPDKDEKRSLSKLSLVATLESRGDSREITTRLDLLPGNYFIVPYCSDSDHEGDFLLRVLGEKDPIAAKTGCLVS